MPLILTCPNCRQRNRVPASRLAQQGRCGACKAPLGPAAEPMEVTPAEFDEIIRDAGVPVLVDFWAAWCGPCRMAAPEVARTAADMRGRALVLKVDTEKHPELAARYHVYGIPNFAVFRDGHLAHQQAGVVDHTAMEQWLADPVVPSHS